MHDTDLIPRATSGTDRIAPRFGRLCSRLQRLPSAVRGGSLRAYIARFSAFLVVPLAGILGYGLYAELNDLRDDGIEAASHMAQHTADDVSKLVSESRVALGVLSQHRLLRTLQYEHCTEAVQALSTSNPLFNNVVVRDSNGAIVCAILGQAARQGDVIPAKASFTEAMHENRFLISRAAQGGKTRRWFVVFSHPVRDSDGLPNGLINVRIYLDDLSSLATDKTSYPHRVTHIIDQWGTVIASSQAAPRWIGSNRADHEVVRFALARRTGHMRAPGLDGVERFQSVVPIEGTDWKVISGIPVEQAFEKISFHARTAALAVALLTCVLFLLWLWVRRTVAQPMEHIAAVATEVAAGNDRVRADVSRAPAEILTVARAFNAMLDAQAAAQARIRESEERFKMLASMSSDWFWEQDENLRFTAVHGEEWKKGGFALDSFIGKTRWEIGYGGITEEQRARYQALIDARLPFSDLEFWRIGRDGKRLYRSISGQPVFGPDGRFKGYFGSGRDITARKEQEQELIRREQLLRLILDNIPVMVCYVDPNGKVVWANHQWEGTLGWSLAESQALDILTEMYPDLHAREEVRRFIAAGGGVWADFKTRTKDGRVVDTRWANVLLHDGTSIGIGQDVTERKKREQALHQSEDRLRHAYQERERLAQDLHDGIVQSIYAVGLVLEEVSRQVQPHNPAAAGQIETAVAQLNGVIREVRDHIVGLKRQDLDWMQLLARLQSLVHSAKATHSLDLRLEVDRVALARLSPGMAHDLLHIVREAVSNSLRHSRGRNGLVSISERGGRMQLSIEDDGAGFEVASAYLKGNGLCNIAARADALSASFEVRSAPGQGTRIQLDIPLEAVDAA